MKGKKKLVRDDLQLHVSPCIHFVTIYYAVMYLKPYDFETCKKILQKTSVTVSVGYVQFQNQDQA